MRETTRDGEEGRHFAKGDHHGVDDGGHENVAEPDTDGSTGIEGCACSDEQTLRVSMSAPSAAAAGMGKEGKMEED